jgi:hypothetical protein
MQVLKVGYRCDGRPLRSLSLLLIEDRRTETVALDVWNSSIAPFGRAFVVPIRLFLEVSCVLNGTFVDLLFSV